MVTEEQIKYDLQAAIPLPDCPVKREHAIASRIWMLNKINEYLTEVKNHYESIEPEPEY